MRALNLLLMSIALCASNGIVDAQPCFPQTPLGTTDRPSFIDMVSVSPHPQGPSILASVHEASGGFGANGIVAWRYPDYQLQEILDPQDGTRDFDFFIKMRFGDSDDDGSDTVVALSYEDFDNLYLIENGIPQRVLTLDVNDFELGDLNADGDLDIIAISSDYELWWYDDGVWTQIYFDMGNKFSQLFIIDYNNDKFPDVVFGPSVYINTGDPFTSFIKRALIVDGQLTPADLDNDGDIDFAVTMPSISWLESSGGINPNYDIHTISLDSAIQLQIGDINGDGSPDIAGGSRNWYVNNGMSPPEFQLITIDNFDQIGAIVGQGDFNGDSYTDFVARGVGDSTVTILYNSSVQNSTTDEHFFSLADAIDSAVNGDTVSAISLAFNSLCNPSLDLQGKALNIVSGSYIERSPETQTKLAHGSGLIASNGSITISGTLNVPLNSTAVVSSTTGTNIAGPLEIESGAELVVLGPLEFSPGGGLSFTRKNIPGSVPSSTPILTGDMDGDADIDFIQGQSWWENINSATSLIKSTDQVPSNVLALADLDQDGIADPIISQGWYRNQQDLPDPFVEYFSWPEKEYAHFCGVGDFNNDNDIDIFLVATDESYNETNELLLENNGMSNPEFSIRNIGEGPQDGWVSDLISFTQNDFSGDGFLDYAIAYSGEPAFYGYEVSRKINNTTTSPSFSGFYLAGDVDEARSGLLTGADIDGDGAAEVVYAPSDVLIIYGPTTIYWPSDGFPIDVQGVDLNNDSIDEILVLESNGTLVAYRTRGQGVSLLDRIELHHGVQQFAIADLDQDGNTDIIISDDSGLAWLENGGSLVRELQAENSGILALDQVILNSVELIVGETSQLESTTNIEIDPGSTVLGSGTIKAPIISSSGSIAPNRGQTILVDGNYEQFVNDGLSTKNGRIQIDLGDGTSNSSVQITGTARLSGALLVTADQDFDPEVGTQFLVLSAGTPIGTDRFDVILLPGLTGGKFLRPIYDTPLTNNMHDNRGSKSSGGTVTLVVSSLDSGVLGDPTSFILPGLASGASLGDLNEDGFDDLAVVIPEETDPLNNPGTLAILINGQTNEPPNLWPGFGGGTIILPTGPFPSAVAIGDLDQNLGNDLALSLKSSGNAEFYISNGSPDILTRFEPGQSFEFSEEPEAIALADLNNDNFPDVILAGHSVGGLPTGPGEISVRLNLGRSGLFWNGLETTARTFVVGSGPRDLALRDLDEEKDLDLISANWRDDSLSVLENLGGSGDGIWNGFAPAFDISVGTGPILVFARDLDEEKDLDLISFDSTGNSMSIVLQTDPDASTLQAAFGTSIQIPIGSSPLSGTLWDPDSDGDPDPAVIVINQNGDSVVRLIQNLSVENAAAGTPGLSFFFDQDIASQSNPYLLLSGRLNNNEVDDLAVLTNPFGSRRDRAQSDSGSVYTDFRSTCEADMNDDGVLNFFDVSAFLSAFTSQSPTADFNDDGTWNFFDVSAFLSIYGLGCP